MDSNLNLNQEIPNILEEHNSFIQELDYSFELKERYKGLLDSYSLKKYKKARIEITRLNCFSDCNGYWKIIHLKIKCQEKIIEKKLQSSKANSGRTSVIDWLAANEADIQFWFKVILPYTIDSEDSANKVELLITFILNQSHYYAKFCVHQGLLDDCISFLALAENLIRRASGFINSPDTLFVIQRIYLFFSSLYITNENYPTAKKYLNLVLKLAFKEIELRVYHDFALIIALDEMTSDNREHLLEVLLNITTAMYQLGVCYENESDLDKASQAYNQSKWFACSFLSPIYPELIQYICDLEKRIRLRIELYNFIKREKNNLSEIPIKKQSKANKYYDEFEKIKKFEKLQAYIESLKLTEVDDDEIDLLNEVNKKPMSERVNVATKTIHVLNYLMSNKFQDVVKEMDKIEINKLDKETKSSIEKRILSIKNTERVKLVKDTIKQLFSIPSKCIPVISPNHSNDYAWMTTAIPTISNESTINGQTQGTFFSERHINTNNQSDNKTKRRILDIKSSRPITAFSKTRGSGVQIKRNYRETDLQRFYSNKQPYPSQSRQNKANRYESISKTSQTSMHDSNSYKNTQFNFRNSRKPNRSFQIEKIKYSKYVFNKAFRRKIDNFRVQFDKELKFQKDLLSCKREEKRVVTKDISEKAIKRNCEIYFSNEYEKQKKLIKEKDVQNRIVENINEFIKKEGYKGDPLTTIINNYIHPSSESSRKKEIHPDTINKLHLNKIEYDLETISKTEEYLKKKSKKNA